MKRNYFRTVGAFLALMAVQQLARGDLIVLKDGGVVDGKVVSRDTKGLTVQPDGQKTTQNFAADTVARVLVIDEKGALVMELSRGADHRRHCGQGQV